MQERPYNVQYFGGVTFHIILRYTDTHVQVHDRNLCLGADNLHDARKNLPPQNIFLFFSRLAI